MASFKPALKKRQEEANEQYNYPIHKDICEIIEKALKEVNINGKILKINPKELDYEEIRKKYGTNDCSHIIFIQFTQKGHIAVVGAGKDISFSKNVSCGTWKIISAIEGVEWDDKMVIVIPILNIKNCRIKKGDNILTYRNGVEHYLGNYLSMKKIPILNYYQHKNYSDMFWEKCKENDYII